MRTYVIITLLLVLCILNSCQKEFEDPNDPVVTTANFTAKINGVQFVAAIYGATRRTSDSVISIAGKSNDGQQIVFTVSDSGVHVYHLEFNSSSNFGGYVSTNSLAFSSNEGSSPLESGGNMAIVSIDSVKD